MTRAAWVQGIYPLLNEGTVPLSDFPAYAKSLADLGITVIQLRIKKADDSTRVDVQRYVLDALRGWDGLLVIDDRADLAKMAFDARDVSHPAVGLHLGQTDLSPTLARAIVGPDVIIGLSTHGPEDVARAAQEPIDYIGFGPFFATATKANPDPVVGLSGLADATKASRLPVVAIGGIEFASLADVRAAGATAAATVSLLWPTPVSGPADAAFVSRALLAMETFA